MPVVLGQMIGEYDVMFDYAALVVYLIILFFYYTRNNIKNFQHFVFGMMIWSGVFATVLDIISAITIALHASYLVVTTLTATYLVMQQMPLFLFCVYLVIQVEIREKATMLTKMAVVLPILILALMGLFTPHLGLLCQYSQETGYSRGKYAFFPYIAAAHYVASCMIGVSKNKDVYNKSLRIVTYIVCLFGILPYVIQLFAPNLLITCFGCSLSILLLMFTVHDHDELVDSVTGLQNLKAFTYACKRYVKNEVEIDIVFVRIADNDLITLTYGIDKFDMLAKEVGSYLIGFCGQANTYYISHGYYAIIVRKNFGNTLIPVGELEKEVFDKCNDTWTIDGLEMLFSSYILAINYPTMAPNVESILSYMTYIKKTKRQRYGIIPPSEAKIRDRYREERVELAIERGFKENNFQVYFQPICTAKDKKYIIAEALIRLCDPELGWVSPAEFIPIAEKTGKIIQVGKYVLETSCKFIVENDLKKLGIQYIEINLSVIQCLQRNFVGYVKNIVKEYGINPNQICFEITETAANCSPEAFTKHLESLNKAGFKLALDDFGSGYGNLQRLLTSPFDIIKFDKDTTQKICESAKFAKMAEAFLELLHSLEKEIVAEGVETLDQYELCRRWKCDYIQGFVFSKPLPPDDFLEFVEANNKLL